ncbi:Alpha-xylosidase [compost metagenome]
MPMMQFSVAPWRVLDKEHFELCKEAADIHVKYSDYIIELAKNASETGQPIIRPMSYDYPESGVKYDRTQFMLGDKVLVAPVLEKGAETKEVFFPRGKWQSVNAGREVIQGPRVEKVKVDLAALPVYEKV